jgi:hypothetical protein
VEDVDRLVIAVAERYGSRVVGYVNALDGDRAEIARLRRALSPPGPKIGKGFGNGAKLHFSRQLGLLHEVTEAHDLALGVDVDVHASIDKPDAAHRRPVADVTARTYVELGRPAKGPVTEVRTPVSANSTPSAYPEAARISSADFRALSGDTGLIILPASSCFMIS